MKMAMPSLKLFTTKNAKTEEESRKEKMDKLGTLVNRNSITSARINFESNVVETNQAFVSHLRQFGAKSYSHCIQDLEVIKRSNKYCLDEIHVRHKRMV